MTQLRYFGPMEAAMKKTHARTPKAPPKSGQESGLDEYRRLMAEFYMRTGYLYFLDRKCQRPKVVNPSSVLDEIDGVIDGFAYAPATNYNPWRQQLRDVLKELDLVQKIAGDEGKIDLSRLTQWLSEQARN